MRILQHAGYRYKFEIASNTVILVDIIELNYICSYFCNSCDLANGLLISENISVAQILPNIRF